MAGGGQNFRNPELRQIWEELADGNALGYLQILANAANVTNSLVSVVEFEYTDPLDTAFTKYQAWIAANPDWTILNEIQYPNPSETEGIAGTPVIMVRYKGEKTTADDPGA